MNLTQYKFVWLMLMNFLLGATMFTFIQFNQDLIWNGLYHKIIQFQGVNIPVGVLSGVVANAMLAFLAFMVISVDIIVYKKGIDGIPMREKKKPLPTLEPIESGDSCCH